MIILRALIAPTQKKVGRQTNWQAGKQIMEKSVIHPFSEYIQEDNQWGGDGCSVTLMMTSLEKKFRGFHFGDLFSSFLPLVCCCTSPHSRIYSTHFIASRLKQFHQWKSSQNPNCTDLMTNSILPQTNPEKKWMVQRTKLKTKHMQILSNKSEPIFHQSHNLWRNE